jgi:hypothetical protein
LHLCAGSEHTRFTAQGSSVLQVSPSLRYGWHVIVVALVSKQKEPSAHSESEK